jgi:serine/threonine-protein kinase
VLHRDLKPGNVIVGRHGETLVVDWGLAKVTGRSEPGSGERTLAPSSASGSAETLPGSALGTPAYMSPEQARGDLDRLGPRSDVYSLGATLYYLLTGKPPLEGDVGDVLRKVQAGQFPPPRALDPSLDRALEAVCRKAMALEPEGRYASCHALAEDVERWLADEPVAAWPEPWTARAHRWAKRRRTLVTSSAAALVVAVVGQSLGLLLLEAARRRESKLNDDLRTANSSLAKALKDVESANATANRRLDQTMEAIRDYYTGVSEDVLLGREEFRDLREKLLAKPLAFYEALARELESAPAEDKRSRSLLADGRFDLGRILWVMGRHEESQRQSRAAIAAYEALIAAARPDVPDYQDGLAASYSNLGLSLSDTGDQDGAIAAYRKAIELGEALAAARPGVPDNRERLASSYRNLGVSLSGTGDKNGAVAAYLKAIELGEALATAQPDVPDYQDGLGMSYSNLGASLRSTGDQDGAIAAFRRAIERYEALVAAQPGVPEYQAGLALGYSNLGDGLQASGDLLGAVEASRKAIERLEALIAVMPGVPGYRHYRAVSHANLGQAQQGLDHHEEAIASFRDAIQHGRVALEAAPGIVEFRQYLAEYYKLLIESLRALKREQEADEAAAELRELQAQQGGSEQELPADPFAK